MKETQPDFIAFVAALFKRGIRSPIQGYAPGKYMGSCHDCGETMVDVDKRASSCLPCAVATSMRATAETIAEAQKRGRRIGRQSVVDDLEALEIARKAREAS